MTVPVRRSIKSDISSEDALFKTYSEKTAEDKLIEFVEEQIQKMRAYSSLGNVDGMPGFYELNQALMGFNDIHCSLISMNVLAKNELHAAAEEFDQWLSEKYLEARQTLNPTSLSAQKWASSKELEMWVRVTYRDEYKKLENAKNAAEMKVAFIRRLLDAWQSQSLILNRLCKNIEVEAMQLSASVN